jgi:hypothetical protein
VKEPQILVFVDYKSNTCTEILMRPTWKLVVRTQMKRCRVCSNYLLSFGYIIWLHEEKVKVICNKVRKRKI